jgi:hypothetical protein
MSQNKRRGLIPCGSSGCSSASSEGRHPLYDDDDEDEVNLYSPPSPSECQKFNLPERPSTSVPSSMTAVRYRHNNVSGGGTSPQKRGSIFERRNVLLGPSARQQRGRSMYRPATSVASNRSSSGPNSTPHSRSSTAVSFQSSSTSKFWREILRLVYGLLKKSRVKISYWVVQKLRSVFSNF